MRRRNLNLKKYPSSYISLYPNSQLQHFRHCIAIWFHWQYSYKEMQNKNKTSSIIMRQKTFYWTNIVQKVVEIITESYQKDLTATRCSFSLIPCRSNISSCPDDTRHTRNLPEHKKFYATPLSNWPDHFWSLFQLPCVVQPLNNFFCPINVSLFFVLFLSFFVPVLPAGHLFFKISSLPSFCVILLICEIE